MTHDFLLGRQDNDTLKSYIILPGNVGFVAKWNDWVKCWYGSSAEENNMDYLKEVALSCWKVCRQEIQKRRIGCSQRGSSMSKGLEIQTNMFGDTIRRLSSLEVEINIRNGGWQSWIESIEQLVNSECCNLNLWILESRNACFCWFL